MSATITTGSRRELAQRSSNGIAVQLLWDPADNSVSVSVEDTAGVAFEIAVAPERALDAFHHPFAYALSRADAELLDVTA